MTVRIRRVTTTRAGGVSAPPFDTFNLGDHVGDDPSAVAANRSRLAAAIGLPEDHVVWMNQVHGDHVEVVRAQHTLPEAPHPLEVESESSHRVDLERRAAHQSISDQLDGIEADLLARLGVL